MPKVDDEYLRKYSNLVRDRLDPRDLRFQDVMATIVSRLAAIPSLPPKVDYSSETAPVGDQEYTGSCVGWAATHGLYRWLYFKKTGTVQYFSVRFLWMSSKEIDQWVPNVTFDLSGTSIRDAFKVLRKYGVCTDTRWPFNQQLPDPDAENDILQEALQYRIGNYHLLSDNDERLYHLANIGPFVIGVPVYSNWSEITDDGLVPDPSGLLYGGHAVLVVGYDESKKQFRFQNSWGPNWGDKGYGYFTYEYVEKHSWSSWGADRLP